MINLGYFRLIGIYWVALYVNGNNERAFYDVMASLAAFLTYSKRNQKLHRKQKCYNKYLENRSIRFDNVWILLYCVY